MPLRGGDSALHRGSGDGLAPVLLAGAKDASPASLQRLEHEYALRDELDASSASRSTKCSRVGFPSVPPTQWNVCTATPPALHERARDLGIRELLRKPLQRKDIAECFGRVLSR